MENLDVEVATLLDEKLFELCRKYGAEARLWKQRFMGLIPEVNRRRLFEKKGFGSIFEFAAKLGGVSKEQVLRVLMLDRTFQDKPILKNLLQSGEASINKLSRITTVATPENESFWARQVEVLPKSALETLVRDEKAREVAESPKPVLFQVVLGHEELNLCPKVIDKLLELKYKGIDINEMILKMLGEREEKIEQKKDEISEKMKTKAAKMSSESQPSRYMATEIRHVLKEEHGTKCSIEICWREAENIHHAQRFALSQNNDPHFLAPLCREHHLIAHSIDLKFHEKRKMAVG